MNANALTIPRECVDYEADPIRFPSGEIWLYSDRLTGHPNGAAEFKLYTSNVSLWPMLREMNGVEECAVYADTRGHIFGRDFIVQAFSIRGATKLLQQQPELFDLVK